MTDIFNHTMLIDDRLDSYKSFFDHGWAGRIMDLARDTKLERSVFNLCVNWKAVANTHVLPWFTMGCVSNFAKGLLAAHEPLGSKAGRKNNLYKLVLMDVAEDAMTCACKMRRSRHGFAASFVWSLSNWTSGDVGNGRRRNRATPVGAGFRWWLVPPACRVQPSWRD